MSASAVIIDGVEYAKFGEKMIRRTAGEVPGEWETCPPEEIPEGWRDAQIRRHVRMETGQDPWREAPPEGEASGTASAGAVILPNQAVDNFAAAIGTSSSELRKGLNSHRPFNSPQRIAEKDFDAYGKAIGLSPAELRARFRGDYEDPKPMDDPNPL